MVVTSCSQIRSAGLGIAVALTLTENGCSMVCKNCSHVSDGVWGSAMAILGNESECSMVRYQVRGNCQPFPFGIFVMEQRFFYS